MRAKTILTAVFLWGAFMGASCRVGAQPRPSPSSTQGTGSDMLALTLELDRDIFRTQDPISIRITLTNLGDESLVVNARLAPDFPSAPEPLRDITFTITSPSGREIRPGKYIHVRPLEDSDFVVLPAGAAIERDFPLSSIYPFVEPGEYLVRATYQNTADPEDHRSAWKGQITSNVVEFTLEP